MATKTDPTDLNPTADDTATGTTDTETDTAAAGGHETEPGQLVTDGAGVNVGLVVGINPTRVAWLGPAATYEAPLFDFNAEPAES